jgi:transposase
MRRKYGKNEKLKNLDDLTIAHPHAAGLDIGAREIWACVPSRSTEENVRLFATFTADLHALADWLVACGVTTLAMESTGVYWIPVFEILEVRGLQVFLVNAWHLKHVPGRKSDVLDCQWIQKLHSLGLLRGSFRPDAQMCPLRPFLRHRAALIQHRAPIILHMQKALQQMNLQPPLVLSDITGETGQKILRAIVAGERDPLTLAQLHHPGCKSSEDEIAKALTGTWRTEHLFALKQSLELFDFYSQQLATSDAELARQFAAVKPRWEGLDELPDLPKLKPASRSKNQPAYNVRAELLRITGVDLVAVEGISASLAQTILTEIGADMSRFPTEKHFASCSPSAPA